MSDWFYEKIICPMTKWADKHPWFPTIISIISLIIAITGLIIQISRL